MTKKLFKASLSQAQGRTGYSIIFRHPVRRDHNTGKIGVRVRRGLGTRDREEATQLCEQLNQILADPRYQEVASRVAAQERFDQRVVDIYFDKMEPSKVDFRSRRNEKIPLPERSPEGYRHVLLVGTTGAGKTTLLRQFIGTDPKERFPSTSTSKTTVADTEIVLDDGDWQAVVTFAASDEVREHLSECITAAVFAVVRNSQKVGDDVIQRHLLSHVNQRYRFNYILGDGPVTSPSVGDFDDEDEVEELMEETDEFSQEEDAIDLEATNELLADSLKNIRRLAATHSSVIGKDIDTTSLDEDFEVELDKQLREDEVFHRIADGLMDEIEKRFALLLGGEVSKNKQGWPLTWYGKWPREERKDFLNSVSRFSSNYAPRYGRLLTPLVNGIRVSGPFEPRWLNGPTPQLVLFDGEGLGHTPKSSSSVSTRMSQLMNEVDAVVLVDNAAQPMQAAPLAAMRELVATGNGRKLILAFSHFDAVEGDNLRKNSEKATHVLASAENVLNAFGEELGTYAERILRKRIENARYFLANLQKPLNPVSKDSRSTISHLRKLLSSINEVIKETQSTDSKPVYDQVNLVLEICSAAKAFRESWSPRLGRETRSEISKEHWTRIRALNRRLAEMDDDEYDDLRPVADLRQELRDHIYRFIQQPSYWEGDPDEDTKQSKYDLFADNLAVRLTELTTRRVWLDKKEDWERAFRKSGRGSTFVRAEIIDDEIFRKAAEVPDSTAVPGRTNFLNEVIEEVADAAIESGAQLQRPQFSRM